MTTDDVRDPRLGPVGTAPSVTISAEIDGETLEVILTSGREAAVAGNAYEALANLAERASAAVDAVLSRGPRHVVAAEAEGYPAARLDVVLSRLTSAEAEVVRRIVRDLLRYTYTAEDDRAVDNAVLLRHDDPRITGGRP